MSDCDAAILSNLRLDEIDLLGYPVTPIVAPVCHLVPVALRAISALWRIALSSDRDSILSCVQVQSAQPFIVGVDVYTVGSLDTKGGVQTDCTVSMIVRIAPSGVVTMIRR